MTNAQVIGKQTMLARLIVFHTARFERNGMAWKAGEFVTYLKGLSTRKLSKEYDDAFAILESKSTCENDGGYTEMLKMMNSNIEYSSALMG